MTANRARAKSLILRWFDKRQSTQAQRRRFSADIDRFFDAIASRADWCECLSTLLDDDGAVEFSMGGGDWKARPSGKGLVVSSIVPGWNFGWRGILRDELADYILSWLGHYARQYIHRSNIAKVLMAAWEKHGLILHPFGSSASIVRYGPGRPRLSNRKIFAEAEELYVVDWGRSVQSARVYQSNWISRNTLDPAIHQGIYHFLRAQSLLKANFELEALAAYDCVMHSLQGFDWTWAPGNPMRDRRDLISALGMGKRSQELSEHVYYLRNQFVAHAGGWRWWDTGEFLDDDVVPDASRMASRALRKAADVEPMHRRIEPAPPDWALWLEEHFPLIWTAVWFREP